MSEETFTSRKLNWVRCVMHDPLVPPWAFEIAYCIISHVNASYGRAFVSDETLADESGISVRTVRRARSLLHAAGWLNWKRTSTANVYEPLFEKVNGMLDAILIKRDERQERRKQRRTRLPKLADHRPRDGTKLAGHDRPQTAEHARPKLADIHLRGNTLERTPYSPSVGKEELIKGQGVHASCLQAPSNRPASEARPHSAVASKPSDTAFLVDQLMHSQGCSREEAATMVQSLPDGTT